jgi:hypothetical protein
LRLVQWLAALIVVASVAAPALLAAQIPREGRLLVTVTDPTGAVVPGATVTIVGLEPATKTAQPGPVKTSERGVATFENIPLGRYSIQAEYAGFDPGLLRDVTLRSAENRHVVVLPIKRLQDTVTAVGQSPQAAAADRSYAAFGLSLTKEEIDALSDDPSEMATQLMDLAGVGAVIRVDSFEGAALPPKSQIKSIHITRDQFAAETHDAGATFVDVVTQPGVGPLRVGGNFAFRPGSLSGKSQFTTTKGPEQIRRYGGDLGGTLVTNKSSFSVAFTGQNLYNTPNLNVMLPAGGISEALRLRQPNNGEAVFALLDYAATRDQTLRFGFNQSRSRADNLGVGGYDLPDRAYSTESHNYSFRALEAGPLGRRFFINTRVLASWSDIDARSAVEAPTIRVSDAFTGGGAQQSGGRHSRAITVQSDLDYVRGVHSWRTGVQLDGGWYRADNAINYLGTYTFSSLDAYEAGRPTVYLRRIGDPRIEYGNLQVGIYLQDDIRVRKTLTLSPGVRYNTQMHVSDDSAVDPRFGITWAPFKNGRTSVRSSVGVFHGWLALPTYEQTLRFDGVQQRELTINNPSYPDPGSAGVVPPTSKYSLSPDLRLQRNVRYSLGVDQVVTPRFRFNVLFNYSRQVHAQRGQNLNAPRDGVRPDPTLANVIQATSDARAGWHFLNVNATLNLVAPSAAVSRPRFNWRRLAFSGSLETGDNRNNTEGPFVPPVSGSPATEWGPIGEPPHRVNLNVTSTQLRSFTAVVGIASVSYLPYNITTGFDGNADGILNDRPIGVSRNAGVSPWRQTVNARFTYAISLGPSTGGPPPVTLLNGERVGVPAGGSSGRYRLSLYVSVNNLTNHANLGGFSGVMTSPFFLQPTNDINPRKVDMGMTFSF